MDQMAALRQIAGQTPEITAANVYLFKPGETFAVAPGGMNGTPMPHDEPQETNPPAGVLVYYWRKSPANGLLKLELLDGSGAVRACSASDMEVRKVDTETLNAQAIWEQTAQPPSTASGTHRFALAPVATRLPSDAGQQPSAGSCAESQPASSEAANAAAQGRARVGVLPPGDYTVRLTANGQSYSQMVRLKPDPRLGNAWPF